MHGRQRQRNHYTLPTMRGFVCLNALTSRMDLPVCFEGIDASQAGASGSTDLGGSSKYSGE